MIHIVCDMNCNNFGNYFKVIGLERTLREDENSWIVGNDYYPKGHCYRASPGSSETIKYSEAIDYLFPGDYIKWVKIRFKGRAI